MGVLDNVDTKSVDYRLNIPVWSLANPFRKNVLLYFYDTGEETAGIDDLLDYFAPDESRLREEIEVILHQVILPELAESGVVYYDVEGRKVHYKDNPAVEETLKKLVEMDEETELEH